jgi:hypothetical protein
MNIEFDEENTLKVRKKAIEVLNEIVDAVLAYHPKPTTEKAKKREQERKKIEREDRERKG